MEIIKIDCKFLRGVFRQNTYVLKNGKNCLIIDAGADLDDILKEVDGLKVQAILMTHLHFDHLYYVEDYVNKLGCDVYILQGADDKLLDNKKNESVRFPMTFDIDKNHLKYFEEELKFDGFDVKVIKTPGHSSDAVCFLIENELFSGDTIFSDAVGRTDLYDSSDKEMISSLKKIRNLDYKMCYPGHYAFATKKEIDNLIDSII